MDEKWAEFARHLDELIESHGWALQGIAAAEGQEWTPPWTYTVGLSLKDRPEMIITGLSLNIAGALLNTAAEMSIADAPPRAGTYMEGVLADGYRLAVTTVECPDEGDWFNVGWNWGHRHKFNFDNHGVVQLVWPAVDGSFPTTENWAGQQPLLGPAWWADA